MYVINPIINTKELAKALNADKKSASLKANSEPKLSQDAVNELKSN